MRIAVPQNVFQRRGGGLMPDTRNLSSRQRAIGEVAVIGLFTLVYFLVRGIMDSKSAEAVANADRLISFEKALGFFWEPDIQNWALGYDWLINFMNSFYIYGHWPVLISTLVWILWKHREHFALYRFAMLFSGFVGLFVFAIFPVAPPRLTDAALFIDTVTERTNAYRVLQPPAFTNQYAALPSLHVGWNLLMGIAIFSMSDRWYWKVFAVVMPLGMFVSTVFTANHYIIDGIAGSLLALTGLYVAREYYKAKENSRTDYGTIQEEMS